MEREKILRNEKYYECFLLYPASCKWTASSTYSSHLYLNLFKHFLRTEVEVYLRNVVAIKLKYVGFQEMLHVMRIHLIDSEE